MAISGIGLFLFVIIHLLGNLQIFLGPETINEYGHFLQSKPELVWSFRLGLLVLIALHIWAAVKLSIENRQARPVPYANVKLVAASFASRTMLMSGLIVLVFIIYHLLHFTVQTTAVNMVGRSFVELHDAKGRHDVYRMMIIGFSHAGVCIFYLLGVGLLMLHLSHGASSMFQSLGLRNGAYAPLLEKGAQTAAAILFLGYASIPLAVLFGIIK